MSTPRIDDVVGAPAVFILIARDDAGWRPRVVAAMTAGGGKPTASDQAGAPTFRRFKDSRSRSKFGGAIGGPVSAALREKRAAWKAWFARCTVIHFRWVFFSTAGSNAVISEKRQKHDDPHETILQPGALQGPSFVGGAKSGH